MPFSANEYRILIADDDASIQFFLGELIRKEGFEFDFAGTGRNALDCLKNNAYSLVLLDEKMPNMSGIEVLQHIKNRRLFYARDNDNCIRFKRDNPFVSVNCAAIPETLLESELFGYEKGAFTGASKQHAGKFERAPKGTIFLDEIGDMSLNLQAKLLRVLQNKEIERLGGTRTIKVDMRLISATNKNLDSTVREGSFREDLLYRVKVFEIKVPPLRERIKDIPLLSDYFVKKYSRTMGRNVKGISVSAVRFFLSYSWPGNVREMENLIQRAIILEETDTVREETVRGLISNNTAKAGNSSAGVTPVRNSSGAAEQRGIISNGVKDRTEAVKSEEERKLIIDALTEARWRRMEAAARLGISRKSLFNKMKKYGLMK